MAFTCPQCQRTSHSPEDERQGYCGACRDWTGLAAGAEFGCGSCGNLSMVPVPHAGRVRCPCGSPEPMSPATVARGVIEVGDFAFQLIADPAVPSGVIGLRPAVSIKAAFRYVRERFGQSTAPCHEVAAQRFERFCELVARGTVSGDLITGLQRNAGTDSGPPTEIAPEDGGIPWSNPVRWRPGDAEW